MTKKILVVTGGPVRKIEKFGVTAKELGLDVTLASFAGLNFAHLEEKEQFNLMIGEDNVRDFDVIYIRLVGKRIEEASLLAQYAVKHGVRLVDKIYSKERLYPSSMAKTLEIRKLIAAGIPLPRTFFGRVSLIIEKSRKEFGYPYVIKSTSGRKARDAWLVDSEEKEKELAPLLHGKEKAGLRFFGQEFIPAGQRERILVIGGKAVAAITRPTKWKEPIDGGVRGQIKPIPVEYLNLAESAVNAVDLDIAGVDILREGPSGRLLVIEVNAAPAWKLIQKDCGLDVEKEIFKFLNQ